MYQEGRHRVSPSQLLLLRIAGTGVCFTLLLLRTLLLLESGIFLREIAHAFWLIPMTIFVTALWAATSTKTLNISVFRLLLLLQSVSVLTLGFVMGGQGAANYLGYLLLIVTIEIALTLPLRAAVPWILVQTSLLAVSYRMADGSNTTTAAVSVIFKLFTYAIVLALKQEADARSRMAALHAEMIASRELLAERSRNHERLRISRDLHDVLGHRLTALSLNLEIARHKAREHFGLDEVRHAHDICSDLLSEVREVVSITRPTEMIDLPAALSRVAIGFMPIRVHLIIPDGLRSCDASRGEVLIRCAQEIITNAVKHARARQVWIDLELTPNSMLRIHSHDDGMEHPRGEEVRPMHTGAGTGLTSMRERFEAFGGSIHIHHNPAEGFVLQGLLPMQSASS
jgi:signal transduction histidine kinase